jgi:hypothetical protein
LLQFAEFGLESRMGCLESDLLTAEGCDG